MVKRLKSLLWFLFTDLKSRLYAWSVVKVVVLIPSWTVVVVIQYVDESHSYTLPFKGGDAAAELLAA